MSAKKQIILLGMVFGLLVVGTACPTIPDLVSGGGSSAPGDQVPPGENITWPVVQIDPTGEDTSGFNQVLSADMNQDGLVDLVTAAYESQPIQVHLQQRSPEGDISFRSFSIAGSGPIVHVSELKIADIDLDGNLDIIMSISDNGFAPADQCAETQGSIVILFAPPDPSDALNWQEYNLTSNYRCIMVNETPVTFSALGRDGNISNYSSIDVADADGDGYPDIVAAFNGCDDEQIPYKEAQLWFNPANDFIRVNQELTGTLMSDSDYDGIDDVCLADVNFGWDHYVLQLDIRDITSVRFSDVDIDGDLDVIALRPDSKTFDITWQDNPLVPSGTAHIGWPDLIDLHPIGESDAGLTLIEIGDLEGDGLEDILAIGQGDRILRWFRHPKDPAAQDFPWDVFNMVQYSDLTPTAIDIDDIDGDGQLDVASAADGRIRWFTPLAESPFEPWSEQFVIDDPMIPDGGGSGDSAFPPINSVHFVDIDDDGRVDIVATLDREGVDNDAVAWFKNEEITDEE